MKGAFLSKERERLVIPVIEGIWETGIIIQGG